MCTRKISLHSLCLLTVLTLVTCYKYSGDDRRDESEGVHNGFVGFTAWAREVMTYNASAVLRFTGELLNEGNHYSPLTGLFTCPVSGAYYISIGIVRNAGSGIGTMTVTKNTQVLMSVGSTRSNRYETLANSVIAECMAGDRIYMQSKDDGSIFGDPVVPRSTFSVMLLYANDSQSDKETFHNDLIALSVSKSEPQSYLSGEAIIYESVAFAKGGQYIQSLNRYTCTSSGLYFVNIASKKNGTLNLHVTLMKNTRPILDSRDTVETLHILANNALVRCEQGDVFTIRGGIEGSIHPSLATTYSLFMLHSSPEYLKHDSEIGFSAYKQYTQTYAVGDTVIFEGIMYNDGGHYEPALSRFICPRDGVYYATLNAVRSGEAPMNVFVDHESSPLFQLINEEAEVNIGTAFSNSALFRARAGDVVQVLAGGAGSIYGQYNSARTTFTVFLMY